MCLEPPVVRMFSGNQCSEFLKDLSCFYPQNIQTSVYLKRTCSHSVCRVCKDLSVRLLFRCRVTMSFRQRKGFTRGILMIPVKFFTTFNVNVQILGTTRKGSYILYHDLLSRSNTFEADCLKLKPLKTKVKSTGLSLLYWLIEI